MSLERKSDEEAKKKQIKGVTGNFILCLLTEFKIREKDCLG
jgi:hypothetical protein